MEAPLRMWRWSERDLKLRVEKVVVEVMED